ncbi:MAG: hypothetical protein RQ760_17580 [Sedimentisphaerales bacterium]|nr:hypothetical protein [Sedimentisphaerales bacterium]
MIDISTKSLIPAKKRVFIKVPVFFMFLAFYLFLRQSFTACGCAINGGKISLHRTGFPAILIRCTAGDVGDKQQTSIQDVELDKYAQLMPVWIETS